jgi:hypothetical protein
MRFTFRLSLALVLSIAILWPTVASAQAPFIRSARPSTSEQVLNITGVNFGDAPAVYLDFNPLVVTHNTPTFIVARLGLAFSPGTYSLIVLSNGQVAVSEVTLGASGNLALPARGTATAPLGMESTSLQFTASAFNSSLAAAQPQIFRWELLPVNNNSSAPGARLSLLAGRGVGSIDHTGLFVNMDGTIDFAPGQTFPGAGDITGITAGPGLAGGGTSGEIPLGIAPNGVTGAEIAPGTITGSDVAPGAFGTQHLAFDPATQPELDTHKAGADHDARYYTKTQADALYAPVRTRLQYSAFHEAMPEPGVFEPLLTVGSFTKLRSESDIVLHWTGHATTTASHCNFQLRIDGAHDGANTGTAVMQGAGQFGVTALFTGLPAGAHTVSIWVRGLGNATPPRCGLNPGNYPTSILVEESGR